MHHGLDERYRLRPRNSSEQHYWLVRAGCGHRTDSAHDRRLFGSDAVPGVGKFLLLLSVPLGLILIIGGIGLILHKYFGYYCIYLATFFGGFGGLKVSYIPFIQRWIKIGPATEDLFLALNLILVAILVWEHWNRVFDLEPFRRNIHRVGSSYFWSWVSVLSASAAR